MKKIFYSLFLLFSIHLSAQTYYPMPTANAEWTYTATAPQYIPGVPIPVDVTGLFCFQKMDGDTIVGGNTYHKIVGESPGGEIPNLILEREDANKKVWAIRPWVDSVPLLYYDYTLAVGDTFCFHDQPSETDNILCVPVSQIDSILVNGSYRKQFHFLHDGLEERWVEGIGSIVAPWGGFWSYIGNFYIELNCFSQENVPVFGACNYVIGTGIRENENYTGTVQLFPNPANSGLHIQSNTLKLSNADVEIYSVLGEKVMFCSMVSETAAIDVSGLKPGEYFIVFRDKQNNNIYRSRFIKADK